MSLMDWFGILFRRDCAFVLDFVDDLDCGWRLLACFCGRCHLFCMGDSSYMILVHTFFLFGCSNATFIAFKKKEKRKNKQTKQNKKFSSNQQLMKPLSCPRIGSV